MRLQTMVLGALLLTSAVAHAGGFDRGRYRRALEESIRLEEERMRELETVATNDERLASELENGVKARERSAASWEIREREFMEIANLSGGERGDLEALAREMRVFSEHDRGLANGRRTALDAIRAQIRSAREGIMNHRAHIDRLRDKLARL
jgi:hypothetical protein